ncbi:hypothetical protein BS78_01G041200 [Paspalum vaginatum]|nr:hypothetical protein BS78_01G041200 [Paspalum vaginatum]
MAAPKLQRVLFMAPFLAALLFVSAAASSSISSAAADDPAAASAITTTTIRGARRSLAAASSSSQGQGVASFSLDRYGARGDGKHDDTQALAKAWSAACASSQPAAVLVPGGKRYLLKLVTLPGPCKSSSVTFTVKGTLVASPNRADWSDADRRHWIVFRGVDGLTVNGGGSIDGSGETWWENSCKTNKALPCKEAPTALSFHYCTGLRVQDLSIVNSQQIHMSVEDCTNVQLTGLSITAPGTSPNTDGIHITRSQDVQVTNCKIKTGDDCLSIENGTHNLHVSQVVCGPGHGISIGSLGDDNSRAEVSGITVDTVQLSGTTNGARIKTYQGGSGYARDITFQNMVMSGVQNPIIIDQDYCDRATRCEAQASAVQVSNVVFKNIRGTTTTKDAIRLNCSKTVPCSGIALQDIDLKMQGGNDAAGSTCQNAKWTKSGTVVPQPCSSKSKN